MANTERPASADDDGPGAVYQRHQAAARASLARIHRLDNLVVGARLALAAGVVLSVVLAVKGRSAWGWLALPVGIFGALAVLHARLFAARGRATVALRLWSDGMDRLAERWAGKGDDGARFGAKTDGHLYSSDLDIFGAGGLFELLCTARTPVGQATLARWLCAPTDSVVTRARQRAVAELRTHLALRRDLAVAATAVRDEVRDEALLAWARHAPAGLPTSLTGLRVAFGLVGLVTIAGLVGWMTGHASPWISVAAFVLGRLLAHRYEAPLRTITSGVAHRSSELETVSAAMRVLEKDAFEAPALRGLQQSVETQGLPPSIQVAHLARWVALLEGRRNQIAALVMAPAFATPLLALTIEAWRRAVGEAVPRWMAAVGELEALVCLGTFAFEHPDFPFPEIDDNQRPARFEAEAVGHPLIRAAERVANDVSLGAGHRLLVVSGSNMSGKSTLLRTVGVNAVLAMAGAPVCARRLVLSPLSIGATLQINDSLQQGKSRFYAELTRLKRIVDETRGPFPLLFLLDEILAGTNSHDRRIGAEAILRGLLARDAIGFVTTHDLALSAVTETLGQGADNVHFEDHLEDGQMSFDYRMKPGIVRKSNALALMRAVGLDVGETR